MTGSGLPDSICTCPYELDCKHGVAALLESNPEHVLYWYDRLPEEPLTFDYGARPLEVKFNDNG